MPSNDNNLKQNQIKKSIKKSNIRMALVPISIALAFGLGFVIKQMFFR
jgi:hypothetical protein